MNKGFQPAWVTLGLFYLQQQTVVDLREDGRVVVDVSDGDGDEDGRGQRRAAFVSCLHRQGVVRDLQMRRGRVFT